MRIVFSRKGVDSAAGRCASVVRDGRCLPLPIPAPRGAPSRLRYRDLGLPATVAELSRGALQDDDLCHADPAFHGGLAALGQVDQAQTHLCNRGVGPGDVFLFFGVFAEGSRRAHRIFGYLRVAERRLLGPAPQPDPLIGLPWPHPHTEGGLGRWADNNTVYLGEGATGAPALDALCLSHPDGPLTRWRVPGWLARRGLSYHDSPARWAVPGEVQAAARGQEFVTDIGDDPEAHDWLDRTIDLIRH
jgi:hypothetical protein